MNIRTLLRAAPVVLALVLALPSAASAAVIDVQVTSFDAAPGPFYVGQPASSDIVLTNQGDLTSDPIAIDSLDVPGLDSLTVSYTTSWDSSTCTGTYGVCTLPGIPGGGTLTITVAGIPDYADLEGIGEGAGSISMRQQYGPTMILPAGLPLGNQQTWTWDYLNDAAFYTRAVAAPATFAQGSDFVVTGTAHTSGAELDSATLTMTVPEGVTFDSAVLHTPGGDGPACGFAGGVVTCTVANPVLPFNGTTGVYEGDLMLELHVTADDLGDQSFTFTHTFAGAVDGNAGVYQSGDPELVPVTKVVEVQPPHSSVRTVFDGTHNFHTGDTTQLQYEVHNDGVSSTVDTIATLTLPSGFTATSATMAPSGDLGATVPCATATACALGDLAPDAWYLVLVDVTTPASATTGVARVDVTSDPASPDDFTPLAATALHPLVVYDAQGWADAFERADLTIGNRGWFATTDVGGAITNTSTSTNATNVVVRYVLPAGVSFVAASSYTSGQTCARPDAVAHPELVECTITGGIFANGNSQSAITVSGSVVDGTTVTMSVSADQLDPDTSDNTFGIVYGASSGGGDPYSASDLVARIDGPSGAITPFPSTYGVDVLLQNHGGAASPSAGVEIYLGADVQLQTYAVEQRVNVTWDGSTYQVDPSAPVFEAPATCSQSGQVLTCSLSNMGTGSGMPPNDPAYLNYEEQRIHLTLRSTNLGVHSISAHASGSQPELAASDNDALRTYSVVSTSAPDASVALARQDTTDPLLAPGAVAVYRLSTSAGGSTSATTTLSIPNGASVTAVTPVAGSSISCPLPGGTDTELICTGFGQVDVTFAFATAGQRMFEATVLTPDADRDPSNDVAIATLDVGAAPVSIPAPNIDLAVDFPDAPRSVLIGAPIQVPVRITAKGAGYAQDARIDVTLPAGVSFDPARTSGSCTLAGDSVTVRCIAGTLHASTSAAVTSTASIGVVVTTAGSHTFSAALVRTITAGGSDPVAANDTATHALLGTGTQPVDARVGAAVSPTSANVTGATPVATTWTFDVTMAGGTASGTGARVDVALPNGATGVTTSSDDATCTVIDGNPTCTFAGLLDGVTRRIVVRANVSGFGARTASASVTTVGAVDVDASNDIASATVRIADAQASNYGVLVDTPAVVAPSTTFPVVVHVSNAGVSNETTNLAVTLPIGFTAAAAPSLVSTSASAVACPITSGTYTCVVAGAATFTAYVTAPASATIGTVSASVGPAAHETDPGDDTASAAIAVVEDTNADLQVSLSSAPTQLVAGTAGGELIATVQNQGPAIAHQPQLVVHLGSGVTMSNPSGGSCSLAGSYLTCELASIAAGSSRQLHVPVVVNAAGTHTFTANVSSTSPDPGSANNAASIGVTVVMPPTPNVDLSVAASGVATQLTGTGAVQHLFTVTNTGSVDASGVVVVLTYPAFGTTFSGATPSRGSCGAPAPAGTVTCSIGALAAGASTVVQLAIVPGATGVLTTSAHASHALSDPVAANDTASRSTTVQQAGTADLVTTSDSAALTAVVGEERTVRIVVRNDGPEIVTDGRLALTPTAGLIVVSAVQVGVGSCDPATCAFGTLVVGASRTIDVVVRATAAGSQTLAASATSSMTDPVSANSSVVRTIVVSSPPAPQPTSCPAGQTGTPPNCTSAAPPARDTIAPVVKIAKPICPRPTRGTLRTCTVTGTAIDTGTVTSAVATVQINAYRIVNARRKQCLAWTGKVWKAMTCKKAQATWIKVARHGRSWSTTLTKVRPGTFFFLVRATDAANNTSKPRRLTARA